MSRRGRKALKSVSPSCGQGHFRKIEEHEHEIIPSINTYPAFTLYIYSVPTTILSALYILIHLIHKPFYDVGTIISLTLQIRKEAQRGLGT